MTTILLVFYVQMHMPKFTWMLPIFLFVYVTIEGAFLVANLEKFPHGGYVTVLLAGLIVFVMYVSHRAHEIRKELIAFEDIRHYFGKIKALSNDTTVPKYATHLVFLSTANQEHMVEKRVLYSILQKQPKRADIYWFVHIEVSDEPYTSEYRVKILDRKHAEGTSAASEEDYEYMVRVDFRLGFRMQQRISQYLRLVIKEMIENGEIDVTSQYTSLKEHGIVGDFRFIIIEEFLSQENDLPFMQEFVMNSYYAIKNFTASPEKWFGLDTSTVETEKMPLVIKPVEGIKLVRRS
jgi:KUP system potassium uptake protein